MARQFRLKNKNGATFNLNRPDALFWEPDGLGWGIEAETIRLGETWLVTDSAVLQSEVSGSMVFRGYEQYNEFLQFIQVGGLVLAYMPLSTWRYLDVTVQLGKTEIKPETQRLICDISFLGSSQWYESVQSYQASGELREDSKKYSYKYPFTYANGISGVVVINNGVLPSYFTATIFGYTLNPVYRLYEGNEITASGRINAEIAQGHKLVINTNPAKMEIAEYLTDGTFVRNLYGFSDWSTERLFMLPSGQSQIAFSDETTSIPNAYIEVQKLV